MMRLIMSALGGAVLAGGCVGGNGPEPVVYYVQLVRAMDRAEPPAGDARPLGPGLLATFKPVLRCKSYWEMCRLETAVEPGRVVRLPLNKQRAVEINLTDPRHRRVAALEDGRVVERTTSPTGQSRTIIGGARDKESLWFIVVRRDKPPGQVDPGVGTAPHIQKRRGE